MEDTSFQETQPSGTQQAIAELIPVLKRAVIETALVVVLIVVAVLTALFMVLPWALRVATLVLYGVAAALAFDVWARIYSRDGSPGFLLGFAVVAVFAVLPLLPFLDGENTSAMFGFALLSGVLLLGIFAVGRLALENEWWMFTSALPGLGLVVDLLALLHHTHKGENENGEESGDARDAGDAADALDRRGAVHLDGVPVAEHSGGYAGE